MSNSKLFSSGLSFEQFKTMRMDTLAKILGVDVVMYTNTDLSKMDYKKIDVWLGVGSVSASVIAGALTGLSIINALGKNLDDKIYISYSVVEPLTNKIIWESEYNTGRDANYGLEEFYLKSIKRTANIFPYKK